MRPEIREVPSAMLLPYTQLAAGDTWKWAIADCGYSAADGWTLKYFLRGPARLDVSATASDSGTFEVSVPGSGENSSDLPAGTYAWQAVVVSASGERIELARGTVEVLPNIEKQDAGFDGRSWVKRTLDAIRAVLENRASRIEQNYQIAGRSLGLTDPRTLLQLEGEFAARYRAEQIASGQLPQDSNTIVASFGPSSGGRGGWRP